MHIVYKEHMTIFIYVHNFTVRTYCKSNEFNLSSPMLFRNEFLTYFSEDLALSTPLAVTDVRIIKWINFITCFRACCAIGQSVTESIEYAFHTLPHILPESNFVQKCNR